MACSPHRPVSRADSFGLQGTSRRAVCASADCDCGWGDCGRKLLQPVEHAEGQGTGETSDDSYPPLSRRTSCPWPRHSSLKACASVVVPICPRTPPIPITAKLVFLSGNVRIVRTSCLNRCAWSYMIASLSPDRSFLAASGVSGNGIAARMMYLVGFRTNLERDFPNRGSSVRAASVARPRCRRGHFAHSSNNSAEDR